MSSPLLPSLVVMFAAFLAFAAGQSNLVQDGTTARWPSLQFRFTIKRSAMEVHGESDFSVLANPIMSSLSDPSDNASVLYDTFTAFAEDDILYNYSLVDGVAYVSRGFLNGSSVNNPPVKCMGSDPERGCEKYV
ncbi:hypothetical protein PRIC1_003406 [Phytophthora ramorum]